MSRRKQPSHSRSAGTAPNAAHAHKHGRARGASKGSRAGDDSYLYGFHAVLAALNNPARQAERLCLTRNAEAELSRQGANPARAADFRLEIMENEDITALLPPGAVHQGIALRTSPLPERDVAEVCEDATRVVVLDQVTDPHNFGAILRSAAVFGATALITTDRNSPPFGGALAKAASGGLEQVRIARVINLVRAIDELKELGFEVIGLDGDGEASLPDLELSPRVALVLGAEGAGLRRLTREHCDLLARLPAAGTMKSLNVSNAAAVALYELFRRAT